MTGRLRRFVRTALLAFRRGGSDTYPYGLRIPRGSTVGQPLRLDGADNIWIGEGTTIGTGAWLSAYQSFNGDRFNSRLTFGNDVYVGNYACITAITAVTIEDGCVLSEFVYISDHCHGMDPEAGPIALQKLMSKGEVRIGAHSFVGLRACILPGVTLGRNCVVGANSVVTRSFPDFCMIAGAPARLIKKYSFEEHRWLSMGREQI